MAHWSRSPEPTFCEFKGHAEYFDVVVGERSAPRAGWHYPDAVGAYAVLRDHVAVMPGAMDRCTVDGEVVRAQEGGFYGGWITSRVRGPFKGAPAPGVGDDRDRHAVSRTRPLGPTSSSQASSRVHRT